MRLREGWGSLVIAVVGWGAPPRAASRPPTRRPARFGDRLLLAENSLTGTLAFAVEEEPAARRGSRTGGRTSERWCPARLGEHHLPARERLGVPRLQRCRAATSSIWKTAMPERPSPPPLRRDLASGEQWCPLDHRLFHRQPRHDPQRHRRPGGPLVRRPGADGRDAPRLELDLPDGGVAPSVDNSVTTFCGILTDGG